MQTEPMIEMLKSFRDKKGWDQRQMADFIGVGYRTYQEIERTGEVKKASVLQVIHDKIGKPTLKSAQKERDGNTDAWVFPKEMTIEDRAQILALKKAVAKMYGKIFDVSLEKALDEIDHDTTLIAREMKRNSF